MPQNDKTNSNQAAKTLVIATATLLLMACSETGSDGLTSLIATSAEPVGSNCAYGGTRVEAGIDANSDSILQVGEVTSTDFLCAQSATAFNGLVYEADANRNNMTELFLTSRDSATVSKLIGPQSGSGSVNSFKVSPDKTKVAVVGDIETQDVGELFVISLVDGSAPVKVSGALVAGGDVFGTVQWAPDSSQLAYIATQDNATVTELYTVFADGTGNVKVSDAAAAGGDVESNFQWSPDSNQLAYLADQEAFNEIELYSVFADGTNNINVSDITEAGGDVINFEWSPDGTRLAFLADKDTDGTIELYTVFANGSGNVRVSGNMVPNGGVLNFRWSPNSDRLAYRADQDENEKVELYTSMATGGSNTKVSDDTLQPSGDVRPNFDWSHDGSLLAYRADRVTDEEIELYTVGADGTGNVRVSDDLTTGGSVQDFEWTPDSSRLAYRADQDTDGLRELYVAPANGSLAAVKVSRTIPAAGEVRSGYQWSPDGTQIAYEVDDEAFNLNSTIEVFLSPATGGDSTEISNLEDSNRSVVGGFQWSPDGNWLAYRADQDTDDVVELYTTLIAEGLNTKVSGPLVTGGNVDDFSW